MKRFLLLSATAVMISTAVNAQTAEMPEKHDLKTLQKEEKVMKREIRRDKKELRKMENNVVSHRAQQAFYADFGNIPASWKRTAYFDEATFLQNGQTMTAYYDYDGELVGSTTHKSFSDISDNAQHYINKKYAAYTKEGVIYFDDNQFNESDMILYGSQFEDRDNYFVVLKKDNETVILQVNTFGDVNFFKKM